jgi:hypothetical protein
MKIQDNSWTLDLKICWEEVIAEEGVTLERPILTLERQKQPQHWRTQQRAQISSVRGT